MLPEAALLAWSALASFWWGISCWLVWSDGGESPEIAASEVSRSLTIFKPLAPFGPDDFDPRGVASFLAQLAPTDELLLGVHEIDRARAEPIVGDWRAQFPQADLRVIWRTAPDATANPKIAWLKILAGHARSELWFWSDADIIAPAGFLRRARAEYAAAGAGMVTWPYVVRDITSAPALLDALYVNAEFFPGVLLLRRLGPVDFGFGAGMLFSRADFEARAGWSELGSALADDFVLGQKLRPVRIGNAVLTTRADVTTWPEAIRHYLRWSKTVRWSRPGGTAARILVLPVLGWLALIITHPGLPVGWLGLAAMMQVDVIAATLLCARVGCRLGLRDLPALELWSVGRAVTWLACWLPWPVIWNRRSWWHPIDKA